jgi:hypothetical protein
MKLAHTNKWAFLVSETPLIERPWEVEYLEGMSIGSWSVGIDSE